MHTRLVRALPGRWATVTAIAVIAIVIVVTRLPALGGGEYDYDEGVYWLSLQSMQAGHPLFSAVYSSQPPAFLLFAQPPWALLGASITAARAVMLAWAVVGVTAGSVIAWRLGGRAAAVAAAVVLAVDPLMVRQSIVLQADGPATSLALVAVAMAALAVTVRPPRWAAAAAAGAGAALVTGVLTKLFDVAAIPPLVALLALSPMWRRLAIAACAGALLAAAVILLPLHGAWAAIWNDSVGLHVNTRSITYGISLGDALAQRWYLEVIAAAGAVFGWRRHRRLVITGLVWVAGGVAAMAATTPLWQHHAVSLSPGLALLVAAGVSSVATSLVRGGMPAMPWSAATLGAAALAGSGVILVSGLGQLQASNDFGPIVSRLSQATSASAEVLGDEQFAQALAHRPAPPQFVDTSHTRLIGSGVTAQQLEDTASRDPVCAVLFATGRMASVPGFEAWVAAHYPERLDAGSGRSLYVIPGCARP